VVVKYYARRAEVIVVGTNGKGFPKLGYQAGFPFAPAKWVLEARIA
jgi:hypothetical protein